MKKTKMMVIALLGMMTRTVVSNASEKMVFVNDLPVSAKMFVMENFPQQSIAFVEKNGSEYEISLNNGMELSFAQDGSWEKVDCKCESVPTSLLPALAVTTTKTLFPGESVIRVDKTGNGYAANLSNSVNLYFNQQGQLV